MFYLIGGKFVEEKLKSLRTMMSLYVLLKCRRGKISSITKNFVNFPRRKNSKFRHFNKHHSTQKKPIYHCKATIKAEKFMWNSISDFASPSASCIEEERLKCPSMQAHVDLTKIVELFITNELIGDIAFQTNLYNIQRSIDGYKVAVKKGENWAISHRRITPPVANAEIKRLFGIMFYMGIINYPNRYWGEKTRIPFIADTMSRNRFEDILAILHFNDNMQCPRDKDDPKYDRLYKPLTFGFLSSQEI